MEAGHGVEQTAQGTMGTSKELKDSMDNYSVIGNIHHLGGDDPIATVEPGSRTTPTLISCSYIDLGGPVGGDEILSRGESTNPIATGDSATDKILRGGVTFQQYPDDLNTSTHLGGPDGGDETTARADLVSTHTRGGPYFTGKKSGSTEVWQNSGGVESKSQILPSSSSEANRTRGEHSSISGPAPVRTKQQTRILGQAATDLRDSEPRDLDFLHQILRDLDASAPSEEGGLAPPQAGGIGSVLDSSLRPIHLPATLARQPDTLAPIQHDDTDNYATDAHNPCPRPITPRSSENHAPHTPHTPLSPADSNVSRAPCSPVLTRSPARQMETTPRRNTLRPLSQLDVEMEARSPSTPRELFSPHTQLANRGAEEAGPSVVMQAADPARPFGGND